MVDDENAAGIQRLVELREHGTPVGLLEQVRERTAQADDRVVTPVDVLSQTAPIGLEDAEGLSAPLGVPPSLFDHLRASVRRGDIEALLCQSD